MIGKPIIGNPVKSKIILIGQAPGIKEGEIKKPFAWTAGKNMFKWFYSIGVNEEKFRENVYANLQYSLWGTTFADQSYLDYKYNRLILILSIEL